MGSNADARGAAYDPNTIMHLLCVPLIASVDKGAHGFPGAKRPQASLSSGKTRRPAGRPSTFFARQRTQACWRKSRTITQRKAGWGVQRACAPLSTDAGSTFNSIEIRSIYFEDCWVLLSDEMPGFHCRLAAAARRQPSNVIGEFLRYAAGISGLTKAPFEAGFEPAHPGYGPDAFANQLFRSCCRCLCDCILPSGSRKIVEKKLRT